MSDAISRAVLAVSGSAELSTLAKATALVALALITVTCARRTSAAVRHAVLAAAFGALVVLPIAALVLRPLTVLVPVAPGQAMAAASAIGAPIADPGATPRPTTHPIGRRMPSATTLIRIGWLIGAALCLMPFVAATWRLRRIRRQSVHCIAQQALARRLAAAAGMSRSVEVAVHEDVQAPMTFGLWRPVILLPPDVETWAEADLQRALVHELEHVRRMDWLVMGIARVACAAYWFHPLAWVAWRRLVLESEQACDDAVVRTADAAAYAEQLVTLARRLSTRTHSAALAMANRSDLSSRVLAVLDGHRQRGRAGRLPTAAIVFTASLFCLVLAPLHASPSPQAGGSALAFQSASVKSSTTLVPRPGVFVGVLPQGVQLVPPPPRGQFMQLLSSLGTLIRSAYGISPYQVSGGPDWLESDRFDVIASMPPPSSHDDVNAMLRSLLARRFNLAAHIERRALPVYVMVTSPLYNGTGPSLVRSARNCTAEAPLDLHAALKVLAERVPFCGDFQSGPGHLAGTAVEIPWLANELATIQAVDRPVVDRTGLSGVFDVDLTWSALDILLVHMQEQLGLELQPASEQVDVLVIDHAEHPTAN